MGSASLPHRFCSRPKGHGLLPIVDREPGDQPGDLLARLLLCRRVRIGAPGREGVKHVRDQLAHMTEFRDTETAQIAIQSALTGHLVFTTVHANNVIDVIGRFLNMGVEPYNFVSSLNCVLAQRLIRMLCPYCKRQYQPTDIELSESGLQPDKYRQHPFYMNVGCDACNHTGYRGRTAIHELLDLSDNIREMIVERRPGSEVRRAAPRRREPNDRRDTRRP